MTAADPGLPPDEPKRRQYLRPPIEEALCEIRFAPGDEWDPTFPGFVYTSLKADYPAKPRAQGLLEAGLRLPDEGGAGGPSLHFRQEPYRVQFRSSDEKRIVAVGPDVLSAHLLRPYTSWENFKNQIDHAIDAYVSIAKPNGVTRIGIRYINRIVIDAEAVELDDYFTSPPDPPAAIPQRLRSFITRMDVAYDDGPYRIVTTFASNEAPEGKTAFLLDIDVIGEWPTEPLPVGEALAVVEDLRARERIAFEALITDSTRELFDAD